MSSTPSASALSAVLRCRGNIFARNQANKKRPSHGSGYSLGSKSGTPGEPAKSTQGSDACVDLRQHWLTVKSLFIKRRAEVGDVEIRWELSNKVLNAGASAHNVRGRFGQTGSCRAVGRSAAQKADAARCSKLRSRERRRGFDFSDTVLFALRLGEGTRAGASSAHLGTVIWTCLSIKCLLRSRGSSDDYGAPVILRNGWISLKNGCLFLSALLSDILRRRFVIANGLPSICVSGKWEVKDQEASFAKSPDLSSSQSSNHDEVSFKGRRYSTGLEAEERSFKSASCPRSSTVSGK